MRGKGSTEAKMYRGFGWVMAFVNAAFVYVNGISTPAVVSLIAAVLIVWAWSYPDHAKQMGVKNE